MSNKKYQEWSLEKLLQKKSEICDELFRRQIPADDLPWVIELVDDISPFVVRRGESRNRNCASVCFEVMSDKPYDPRSKYEPEATQPDEDSLRAAVMMCHWLSGVDNQELRDAREGRSSGNTLAHVLTSKGQGSDIPFAYSDYDIFIETDDLHTVRIFVESPQEAGSLRHTALLKSLRRQLHMGEPPSDALLRMNVNQATAWALL
jgi:hypothetical protein